MSALISPPCNQVSDSLRSANRRRLRRYGIRFQAIALLLFICSLQVSGNGFSQSISINQNNVLLEEVFREIHRQSGYEFIYSSDIVSPNTRVSVHVSNASVNKVLAECLKDLQLTYTIREKIIIIQKAASETPGAATARRYERPKFIRGKVLDEDGKPLSFVSIQVAQLATTIMGREDGTFEIPIPESGNEISFTVSYVGKNSAVRTVAAPKFSEPQIIILKTLSLRLNNIEINGVRKKTFASNSSIVFDREAIEQSQALSVGDVMKYLPGQSIIRTGAALQSTNVLTLRTVLPPQSEQSMNNAFGISVQIDGNSMDNNSNMQALNTGRNGFIASNNITTPNTLGDLSMKNGTLNNNYLGDVANNGIDLRQLQAENIESIEVISGVASARYGDYNTGVVIINTQAGIAPLRATIRTNEGTQNVGVNKGFSLGKNGGVINASFDYLNSNDDPRNKLKSYNRIGGNALWTVHRKGRTGFKNTLNMAYNSTLDRTKRDPDDGNDRMVKFSNWNLRLSNRSELILKKPLLYSLSMQASYNRGRQDSYSQYYLNLRPVMGVTNSEVTGVTEGVFVPGYYLALQQIIGEPVSASARLESTTFLKLKNLSYQILLGATYHYNANKGPGVIVFADRPRFYQTGNKNERARSFNNVPTQENIGFYMENVFNTKILGRGYTLNAGLRGDIQNGFFNLSPRVNSTWRLTNKLNWSFSYGIATKAPSLSQISPGDVFADIPLVNAYTGNADNSVYLVHTEVIKMHNDHLHPYKTTTFETGLNLSLKPVHLSLFLFDRVLNNGFSSFRQIMPVTVDNYAVTHVPGGKPLYAPDGTESTYNITYTRINNGNYNRSKGVEFILGMDKIQAIATSFNLNVAMYSSYYRNANEEPAIPSDAANIDYTKPAVYGVFKNQESKAQNIKSTLTSNTHIPSLRMAIMLTGEVFWLNRFENLATSMYPIGYLNRNLEYFPLDQQKAQSPEYAHLLKNPSNQNIRSLPAFVYTNIHMRLSKEIGQSLRFSFNTYNLFNIRPVENKDGALYYYNGRPSFGAELVYTIK